MISHSTESTPGSSRGRSASVPGSCSASLKQGIWTISFMTVGAPAAASLSLAGQLR